MNERKLIEAVSAENKIYIYGAGLVGKLLFKRLVNNGISKDKITFLVTKTDKIRSVYGRPVVEAGENDIEDSLIIIATDERYHDDIKFTLSKEYKSVRYIVIDRSLRNDLENKQISDRLLPDNGDDIDVLLMTSDNYNASGAFLSAKGLCLYLNKLGIRTIMILPEYGEGEDLLERESVPYAYIRSINWVVDGRPSENYLAANDESIAYLKRVINNRNVKLVHNNTIYTYVGAQAAKEVGVPFLWHIRECIDDLDKCFVDRDYSVELINSSAQIICVSDFTKNSYGFFKDEITSVIYNGVIFDESKDKTSARFDGEQLKIISVGVVKEHKGQLDLVNAASLLKNRNLNFHIFFLGDIDKEYYRVLNQVITHNNLSECIEFCGVKQNVWEYYNNADIAVVSSRGEPFGRCTVEAMMSGCLTIGADAGATPEIISDGINGYLYKTGDYEQLADLILYAVEEKETSIQLISNGIKEGLKYTAENNAINVLKIYEDILKK